MTAQQWQVIVCPVHGARLGEVPGTSRTAYAYCKVCRKYYDKEGNIHGARKHRTKNA